MEEKKIVTFRRPSSKDATLYHSSVFDRDYGS